MEPTLKQVDRTIWQEELQDFVPERIFDFHSHIFDIRHFRKSCPINPRVLKGKTRVTLKSLREQNGKLFPGRKFACLVTG